MITLIVAMDPHNGIGIDGKLPWHIKEDLKLFKERTLNHKVVMGRKTYESIGKPLPNRENIVVTRNQSISDIENVKIIHNLEVFLSENEKTEEEIFIIGGAEIYQVALPYANRLAISHINKSYNCDTFFPMFNSNKYKETESIKFDDFKFSLLEKI
jgi:dihydrofolate reductase